MTAKRRLAEIDSGMIHGWDAGRITVHERNNGKWDVVWVSFRPRPSEFPVKLLGSFDTKAEAVNFGWAEYDRQGGFWTDDRRHDS